MLINKSMCKICRAARARKLKFLPSQTHRLLDVIDWMSKWMSVCKLQIVWPPIEYLVYLVVLFYACCLYDSSNLQYKFIFFLLYFHIYSFYNNFYSFYHLNIYAYINRDYYSNLYFCVFCFAVVLPFLLVCFKH